MLSSPPEKTPKKVSMRKSDMRCFDCTIDTNAINEYFMIHDVLWNAAVPNIHCILCVGCLEKRISRQLRATDFTDAPINKLARHSPRLRSRLTAS